MADRSLPPLIVHASLVDLDGRGLLISGPSGSGKSSLALEMMAMGCSLVADDRVALGARGRVLCGSAIPAVSGMIEARGLGILVASPVSETRIIAELDLAQTETERMPEPRQSEHCGIEIPLFRRPPGPNLSAVFLQFLKVGLAG